MTLRMRYTVMIWLTKVTPFGGVLVLCCAVLFVSCEKPRTNPLDVGGSSYQAPGAVLTGGPGEGQVVDSNTVTFSWSGNNAVNVYRYALSNYRDWSEWSASRSVTFDMLDDTTYSFALQTKYPGQDSSTSYTRNFAVKSSRGRVVKFYKLKNIIADEGEFGLGVWIDGIDGFFSAHFKIVFDRGLLTLVSISGGRLISNSGYSQLILPDPTDDGVIQGFDQKGVIDISTAVLGSSHETLGGTGEVLQLTFRVINAGRGVVSITQEEVRDSTNYPISLSSPIQPDSVIVLQ